MLTDMAMRCRCRLSARACLHAADRLCSTFDRAGLARATLGALPIRPREFADDGARLRCWGAPRRKDAGSYDDEQPSIALDQIAVEIRSSGLFAEPIVTVGCPNRDMLRPKVERLSLLLHGRHLPRWPVRIPQV